MKREKIRKMYGAGIKSWADDDRPRERLLKYGEHTLSDAELLAILLGNGTKGVSALDLARRIMQEFQGFRNMAHIDFSRWQAVKGLGKAKITRIRAALEISRRFIAGKNKDRPQIKSSKDISRLLMPRLRDLKKEVFKIILLDSRNRVIEIIEATEGTVNHVQPILREIFQKAIEYFAVAVICVHNHPSGNPQPSEEDRDFTAALTKAGDALQIKVLDHIIIGDDVYYSFIDRGLL
ncbi:MAG: DNA repair protein RadC [Candidatus Omnitrophica bacterium]|nr:DNA repair protein RadC [Candidatus Omnitrophota bacterium]